MPLTHLKHFIHDVPDFPSPGILFRDITPLLLDPGAFSEVIRAFEEILEGRSVDAVAAIESRGFVLGAPLALALGCGFVPIRKAGKLPRETIAREYALEYGSNRLELHRDAILPGQKVLLLDDVLATGGTARAAIELIREVGGTLIGAAFLIELTFLEGRGQLGETAVHTLLRY
jgi:adenine phosphoribosyltransferase